jgi:hypothetical protein
MSEGPADGARATETAFVEDITEQVKAQEAAAAKKEEENDDCND